MEDSFSRPADPIDGQAKRSIDVHLTIVAALHIAFGAIGVLTFMFAFFVVAGTGAMLIDFAVALVGTAIAALALLFLAILALPGVIGGIGLLLRKEWARILVLVVSFIQLLNIPFGTALGAYSIWVLLQPDIRGAMRRAA